MNPPIRVQTPNTVKTEQSHLFLTKEVGFVVCTDLLLVPML